MTHQTCVEHGFAYLMRGRCPECWHREANALPKPPDLASRLRQYEYGSGAAPSFGAYLYHSPNIATAMPEDFDLEATLEKLRQVREAGEQENLKAVQPETLSCGQCKETLDDRDLAEGKHRCWRCGWREK